MIITPLSVIIAFAFSATVMRRPFDTVPVTSMFAPSSTVNTVPSNDQPGPESPAATVAMLTLVVGSAVHKAKYVVSLLGTMLELVICVPPVAAVNHPLKVNPVLSFGDGSVPMAEPGVRLDVAGVPVPPL